MKKGQFLNKKQQYFSIQINKENNSELTRHNCYMDEAKKGQAYVENITGLNQICTSKFLSSSHTLIFLKH